MGRFVDSIIAYRILKMLVVPFENTDAFKQGIVDKNGKELKKMSDLNTVAERDAYTILHRLVFRLKRIINKVPIENKKLLNIAAAYSLIKEHYHADKEPINLEEQFFDRMKLDLSEETVLIESFFNDKNTLTFRQFAEDAPANSAGSPGVAGFTPDSIGVSVKAQKKHKTILRRDEVNYVAQSKRNLSKIISK
jgi:hypothetical protein